MGWWERKKKTIDSSLACFREVFTGQNWTESDRKYFIKDPFPPPQVRRFWEDDEDNNNHNHDAYTTRQARKVRLKNYKGTSETNSIRANERTTTVEDDQEGLEGGFFIPLKKSLYSLYF